MKENINILHLKVFLRWDAMHSTTPFKCIVSCNAYKSNNIFFSHIMTYPNDLFNFNSLKKCVHTKTIILYVVTHHISIYVYIVEDVELNKFYFISHRILWIFFCIFLFNILYIRHCKMFSLIWTESDLINGARFTFYYTKL